MKIGAFDDVVAVEKHVPGTYEQIREPCVEEDVVDCLGIANLPEQRGESSDGSRVDAAREQPDGILLQQRSRALRPGELRHERWPEDRPPQLVLTRLVDENVILTREEPRQRAFRKFVATLAKQVARATAHDEVDLDLGVPMSTRAHLSGDVPDHPPVETVPKREIVEHHKKR